MENVGQEAFSDVSPHENSTKHYSCDENARLDEVGKNMNPATNSITYRELGSYNRLVIHVGSIDHLIRLKTKLNFAIAESMEESFGKQMKLARATARLSLTRLASMLGVSHKRLQRIESNQIAYDHLKPDFLEQLEDVLGVPRGTFIDAYHAFIGSDYATAVDQWVRAHYPSFAEAQRQLGVTEFSMLSWKLGRYPPPRWFFELMSK